MKMNINTYNVQSRQLSVGFAVPRRLTSKGEHHGDVRHPEIEEEMVVSSIWIEHILSNRVSQRKVSAAMFAIKSSIFRGRSVVTT